MTVCVLSLNTAIDRTLLVPGFLPENVQRAQRVHVAAGGKGLNVARVVRQLGEPVRVIGFLGGMAGLFIRDQSLELGIEQRWVGIGDEPRTCVIIVDPGAETETVINENGPKIASLEVERLLEEIEEYTAPRDILCISGSAPPGVPEELYAEIATRAGERGIDVLADVGGAELRSVAAAHPWALAPNYEESVAAFGPREGPVTMAAHLTSFTQHVLLTLGSEGVLYACDDSLLAVRPPRIHTVNAVGSGDAFVGGFVTGIVRGMEPQHAVRLGVACGTANAARFEQGIGSRAEVDALFEATARGKRG